MLTDPTKHLTVADVQAELDKLAAENKTIRANLAKVYAVRRKPLVRLLEVLKAEEEAMQ